MLEAPKVLSIIKKEKETSAVTLEEVEKLGRCWHQLYLHIFSQRSYKLLHNLLQMMSSHKS